MDSNTPIITASEIPIRLLLAALILPSIPINQNATEEVQLATALSKADRLVSLHFETIDAHARNVYGRTGANYAKVKGRPGTP